MKMDVKLDPGTSGKVPKLCERADSEWSATIDNKLKAVVKLNKDNACIDVSALILEDDEPGEAVTLAQIETKRKGYETQLQGLQARLNKSDLGKLKGRNEKDAQKKIDSLTPTARRSTQTFASLTISANCARWLETTSNFTYRSVFSSLTVKDTVAS